MPYTIIIHPTGEEPIIGEVEQLPQPSDVSITLNSPRRIDGKELHYLSENVLTVIWPFSRLNFIEILPTKAEEEIIGFVRE
ncbi:MAG: hypothetical protein A2029_13565 [Chloroflexi bacterium RBG_19FT_COMBO_47_9]|nr:MAG: hypothetical protein A2029_13565 [Chloroflexi bacterium RBG_19FT_COMBO_47_9]